MIYMNREIKLAILDSPFKQWEVARACGYSESGFSRMLRDPIASEKKQRILDTIERMKSERK